MIVIIDYSIGNLFAIANMFKRQGIKCEISSDMEKIRLAKKLVLPGVGAFDACIKALRATGLVPLLEEKVLHKKTPLLGICVGAQILGHGSEEGSEPGLGWIDMQVKRFSKLNNIKIPHVGWSAVKKNLPSHPLLLNLKDDACFYFLHSYYMEVANSANVLLTAHYGLDFTAGVSVKNIAGIQFHPEKSHRFGKRFLENFAIYY
jgi:glutamine amidotransferase